ncbi:hypothetical protein [Nannocystis pusilla]|uniref:hypothetical protein n=1 Tax=Nannocystis pusilla TaxID=889268 RepID=UPI003DA3697C
MHLHKSNTPDPSTHLISTKLAANACGLSYATFRFLRSMGLAPIPAERKGGRAFYVYDDVIAWNQARLENLVAGAELDGPNLRRGASLLKAEIERMHAESSVHVAAV